MADYTSDALRNIVFVGHGGAGKTTICDQILFKAGAVTRAGSVDEKNSSFDHDDEEKNRGHSIFSSLAYCSHQGKEINLIDTPGYPDFVGAALTSLEAADTAVLTINAQSGIELNTRKMMLAARARGLTVVIAVSKMDADNIIDFAGLTGRIQELFGSECMPVNLPIGVGADFKGVVDLLTPPESAPDGVVGDVESAASELMEKIVEADEDLMERYLSDEAISSEELATVLSKSLNEGTLIPIVHLSGRTGDGVQELLDFLAKEAPSPVAHTRLKALDGENEVDLVADADKPLVARVWKTLTDPFVGKLTFFRILQGTFKADSQVRNIGTDKNERITHLFRIMGKDHNQVEGGGPGDLLAVAKVENVSVGGGFTAVGQKITLPELKFPTPMTARALEPKARGDEQKISSSLKKLADEDVTLTIGRDSQTGELVITGMSALHLDVVLHRLEARFGVGVTTKPPRIPYKETITIPADGHYRHKKQSGGRGQFGEVWFKMEPTERGEGFEFVNEVVGGSIPSNFIPAVEKGVRERLAQGVLAGNVVEDVRVRLHFGKFHDVDSSEAAFKLAASMCFKEVFLKAKPVLLEPVVNLEITVPSRYMGDISGDMNSRRGRLQGMDTSGDMQIIQAMVPMSEVMTYSTELRSMTGGTGSFSMEFSHYDPVPARTAQTIIAKAKAAKEEARS
jgi:elongation factor G